jgi:glutamyl-tRNA synthetase/glutamyl-Q tRNA(Asp) synthetase
MTPERCTSAPSDRTRFAPSPTGYLHLGHVANALWTWGIAAVRNCGVLLRIEDHDRTRCRPEYEARIYDDLAWLGLAPEPASLASLQAGPSPFRQSDSTAAYESALAVLARQGLVYGCACSRSTIAKQLGDGLAEGKELRYPGPCRERGLAPGPGIGTRVRLPDTPVVFEDLAIGMALQNPARQCGDLLVRDKLGNWTYQYAVTVDDLRHGVTLVVRGADLLSSTGRQIALARLLGRSRPPHFLHHPLIVGGSGAKLSKKDRAAGLDEMRAAGLTAADVLGEAAFRTGLLERSRPLPPAEIAALLRERYRPPGPVSAGP